MFPRPDPAKVMKSRNLFLRGCLKIKFDSTFGKKILSDMVNVYLNFGRI